MQLKYGYYQFISKNNGEFLLRIIPSYTKAFKSYIDIIGRGRAWLNIINNNNSIQWKYDDWIPEDVKLRAIKLVKLKLFI